MEVNENNMNALFQTFRTQFNDAQRAVKTRVFPEQLMPEDVATIITVTGAATVHAWMDQIHGMRKWIGDRLIANIKLNKLRIVNEPYEDTVSVPRTAIEDDQFGVYSPLIQALGDASEKLWIELVAKALKSADPWADGNPFFAKARALGESKITNATTDALSAAAVETAIAEMMAWRLAGNEEADVLPENLVVGPSLLGLAKKICEAELLPNAAGTATQSNVSTARMLKVRCSQRLTGDFSAAWYVTGSKAGIKPVCVQKRKLPTLTRLDRDTDPNVFTRGEFLYGTDARGESFLTLPFLAYRGGIAAPAWDKSKAAAAAVA